MPSELLLFMLRAYACECIYALIFMAHTLVGTTCMVKMLLLHCQVDVVVVALSLMSSCWCCCRVVKLSK